ARPARPSLDSAVRGVDPAAREGVVAIPVSVVDRLPASRLRAARPPSFPETVRHHEEGGGRAGWGGRGSPGGGKRAPRATRDRRLRNPGATVRRLLPGAARS